MAGAEEQAELLATHFRGLILYFRVEFEMQ